MIDDDPINQDLVMREKEYPVNQGYGFAIETGILLTRMWIRMERQDPPSGQAPEEVETM
jgi:hypothetical protein